MLLALGQYNHFCYSTYNTACLRSSTAVKALLNKLRDAFGSGPDEPAVSDEPDLGHVIDRIRESEQSGETEPGRRIHQFAHLHYDLRLDYDITDTYRITVSRGEERIYSFSVYCEPLAYDELIEAYRRIIDFLNGEQSLGELPDDALLKGFYFGS